ncbi:MAG: polysaccharide pyruvyl transferase family protein [Clostridia bacterium]|nr:polysaccharide pyruvyl transferase family protein [Clostridia bacterium]
MRIGIITFHRALNYGALLQAYALREALKACGAETSVIDYRNPIIENMYSYPSLFQRKGLKSKMKYILQGGAEKRRRSKFEFFRKQFLNLGDNDYYTGEDISKSLEHFDKFITGSDQVWNYDAHNFDKNYLLSFVGDKKKKFSYAASFGVSQLPEKYMEDYKAHLSDFSACSVREEQGLDILNELGITSGRVDVDPTMLLTKNDWISNFKISEKSGKYIFVYYFELTNTMKEYIERLATNTGCSVVLVGNPIKSPLKCKCKFLRTADPVEFISALANSTYVVTNSFHGTALSIILNKTFYVELLKKQSKVNSRIENILKLFSLEDRIISDSLNDFQINWEEVNDKMAKMRKISLAYLGEIVND